jgi:signal transduction histidine kinase
VNSKSGVGVLESLGMSDIDELREARARLVAAYDAEQRRVERALHDGVQQDLTALSIRLQLLRQLVPGDATDATELLDEIARDVRAAADEIRRVAAEIHPSHLGLWGLGPVLRDAAAAGRATLETVGLRRYPPEIELAAYRLCLAALDEAGDENSSITIHIEEHEHSLRLAIDGPRSALSGESEQLALAHDRIEILGGVFSVAQRAGGAHLVATLPL